MCVCVCVCVFCGLGGLTNGDNNERQKSITLAHCCYHEVAGVQVLGRGCVGVMRCHLIGEGCYIV